MQFSLLADCPEYVDTVAKWYLDEWGYISEVSTLEKSKANLAAYLNRDEIPLIIVAHEDGKAMGVAQLKFREMPQFPEKEHWLGGVYVAAEYRGKGLAEQIVNQIIIKAKALDVPVLYLQTENLSGGLYGRMGWKGLEQVDNQGIEVLVMALEV